MKRKNLIIYALFALIILLSLVARLTVFYGSLPYVLFGDEGFIVGPAFNIVTTGDLNPHFFKYGSLPIYSTAIGLSAGFLQAAASAELEETDQIKSVAFPFYDSVTVQIPARLIVIILSMLAMVLLSVTAGRLFGNTLLWITALFIAITPHFFTMSWQYINSDMYGTFFAILAIYLLFLYAKKETIFHRAVLPGIVAGLCIACKLNFAVVVLPLLLFNVLHHTRKIISLTIVFLLCTAVAFLCVTPFALLDYNTFINDIGSELYHYATEHAGYKIESRVQMFVLNAGFIIGNFGWFSVILATLGVWKLFARSWKDAIIFLSLPAGMLALMSMQKVYSARNLLVIEPFYAALCAIGVVAAITYCLALLKMAGERLKMSRYAHILAPAIVIILLLVSLPYPYLSEQFDLSPDSRNQAISWIEQNIPRNSRILVASSMGMDTRTLEQTYEIEKIPFKWMEPGAIEQTLAENPKAYVLKPRYVMDKRFPFRHNLPKELNNAFRGKINPRKQLGRNPVIENSDFTIPFGDPQITVAIIKRQKAWAAGTKQTP